MRDRGNPWKWPTVVAVALGIVLAARLHLLRLTDDFRFDELKPYLTSLNRAGVYADILSRAAELYDEPLGGTIRVPQSGSLKTD